MKIKGLSIFLLILLIVGLFSIISIIEVQGANTLDYTFEQDILCETTTKIEDSFNIRNQTTITEIYNATYTFYNELGNTSDDIDFVDVDDSTGLTSITVINNSHERDLILDLYDNSAVTKVDFKHFFEAQVSGTIEYWFKGSDLSKGMEFILYSDITKCIQFSIIDEYIKYYDTGWHSIKLLYDNLWYHIKIDFECGSSGYKGLAADKFYVSISGHRYGPYNLRNVVDNLDVINILTNQGDINYHYYYALFGFYWDITNYTGTYFDVGMENTNPVRITWDGSNFWIIGAFTNEVYQYNSTGDYTGVHFDVETQDDSPQGITWDGSNLWIVGHINNRVYQYTSEGVYTGTSFYVGTEDINPQGIIWDGSNFWILGNANDKVYKYDSEGIYTGIYFYVGTELDILSGITYDGFNIWIVGVTTDRVYQYTFEGVYTGTSFYVGFQDLYPTGITWDGMNFWIVGNNNNEVYQYEYIESPYNIGDNMIPYKEISQTIQEVDKFEFAFKNLNDCYKTGDQNPSTWNTFTTGTGYSQIGAGTEPDKDKIVYMMGFGAGNNFGIKKTDFTYNEKFIEIDLGLMFIAWSGTTSFILIDIASDSSTSVIALGFYNDGRFVYIDDGPVELRNDITIEVNYEISLFINYEINLCIIDYVVEGVLIETYVIPLLEGGKGGLKEIIIESTLVGSDSIIVGVDYVGVYANGLSNAGKAEYGYFSFNLNSPDVNWNFERQNLVSIIADGTFAIYSCSGIYSIQDTIDLIFEEIEYNNVEILRNIFDRGNTNIDNPFLIVYISDTTLFNNITYISVEGVKLIEDSNVYYLMYTHSGINPNNNYFRVDLNNRLQFTLTVTDDNLEYIQATFEIDEVLTKDRSISFTSDIVGKSKGFLSLDYTDDTINLIEFPFHLTMTKVILPQTKKIKSFTILITDNDKYDYDRCSGYISDITLLYNPDIEITIITITLLGIIVPLMVMVIPSIIMGKKFGIAGTIITFLLMALVCVIGNLIPVWMFAIIAFCTIGFLVMKEKIEVRI